jgi:hypothetical protein
MIELIARHVIPAAMSVLPAGMDTPRARAMLLAIGLQESRFLHRRQVNYGPARGFWQFEKGGVRGVVKHERSRGPLLEALRLLRYEHLINPPTSQIVSIHEAIEDNDVLACVLARLLLWTLPGALPSRYQPASAWDQYIDGWRPGKPHRSTWEVLFQEAWARVELSTDQRSTE